MTPLSQLLTGQITHKAMTLQLDPDDDEAERKATDDLINSTTDKLGQALSAHLNSMAPQGAGSMPPELVAAEMVRNSVPPQRVQDILAQALREGADLGVSVAVQQFEQIGLGFDWTLPNIAARDWANQYTGQLIQQITDTNRRIVQEATSRWINNGESLASLVRDLEPHFGKKRADLIATTEVTRAYFEANEQAYRATGQVEQMEWRTAVDERVCPICGPRHGKRTNLGGDWDGVRIPAHPRCRCWIVPVVAGKKPNPKLLDNGFPAKLDDLERVQTLGGVEVMRDPATGTLYAKRMGAQGVDADKAYKAMGINVPNSHIYDTPQGPVKLSNYIEGKTLAQLKASDPDGYAQAIESLRKDFAVDALLGNRNVIGQTGDHIIVGADGKVWRANNSSALLGSGAWSKYPDELWTMRNNPVYQGMDYDTLTKQMTALGKTRAGVLDALPNDVKALVAGRYDTLADLVKISNTLQKDKWKVEYIDDFSRHSIGIRKAGIVDNFPKQLTRSPRSINVVDENGKLWDNLRSFNTDSIVGQVRDYMAQNGADHSIIQSWSSMQSGNSWSSAPQALKYFFANQRTLPMDAYYWHYDVATSRNLYDNLIVNIGEKKYRETMAAWHAVNYEFVRNVKFQNNLQTQGMLKLMRTETQRVMNDYKMVPGKVGQMKRGAAESTSIFKRVEVEGNQLTTQKVPHHRIFGNYLFERAPGINRTMFMSDGENEFIAMLEGLEVKYGR